MIAKSKKQNRTSSSTAAASARPVRAGMYNHNDDRNTVTGQRNTAGGQIPEYYYPKRQQQHRASPHSQQSTTMGSSVYGPQSLDQSTTNPLLSLAFSTSETSVGNTVQYEGPPQDRQQKFVQMRAQPSQPMFMTDAPHFQHAVPS